jgi:hypothetical protein
VRKILIRYLGFLQTEEVRLVAFEDAEHTLKTSADGVDIPGDDFHGAKDRGAGRG